jgi:hypothetical protein
MGSCVCVLILVPHTVDSFYVSYICIVILVYSFMGRMLLYGQPYVCRHTSMLLYRQCRVCRRQRDSYMCVRILVYCYTGSAVSAGNRETDSYMCVGILVYCYTGSAVSAGDRETPHAALPLPEFFFCGQTIFLGPTASVQACV